MPNDLVHNLASYAHEAWSGWITYMLQSCGTENEDGSFTIASSKIKRWKRQMETKYEDLPADEQISDIAEAHKIIAVFDDWTA